MQTGAYLSKDGVGFMSLRSAPEAIRSQQLKVVVVGASAGAIEALSTLLPMLPENLSVPIAVVVHVPPESRSVMADLFARKCRMKVQEAMDKEQMACGSVYFAPPDYHLLLEADGRMSLSADEPVLFSRPSIDVLFESAAQAYGDGVAGIVLTGANSDGANGLRAIHAAGGMAIVNDPQEAQVATMPEAALKACPKAYLMKLDEIGRFLGTLVGMEKRTQWTP